MNRRRDPTGIGRFRHGALLVFLVAVVGLLPVSLPDAADARTGSPTSTTSTSNPGDLSRVPAIVDEVRASVVTVETGQGLGSGVVWSRNGLVVTAAHVVGSASTVRVDFADGKQVTGTVVATDPVVDVAVVRAGRHGLTPATFSSRALPIGSMVVAVGSPLGFTNSVTVGVLSGRHRSIPGSASSTQALVDLLQTDAAISPGNSGGALTDGHGRIVGMVEAYVPPSTGAVSLGFAIPASTVVDDVHQLLANGHARHAYLGVGTETLTPAVSRRLGTEVRSGAAIVSVDPASPAGRAGLRPGDVIVAVDGKRVKTAEDLLAVLREHEPGQTIQVTTSRSGKRSRTKITLADRSS